MRGKEIQPAIRRDGCRITPACAGKRACGLAPAGARKDHPRVCGEKLAFSPVFVRELGSPPRVRGKVLPRLLFLACIGITPACAGKSERSRRIGDCAPGSPPRVRGKGPASRRFPARAGITPACAGKSNFVYWCGYRDGDHPRVCGEKLMYAALLKYRRGSPPRVRGKD